MLLFVEMIDGRCVTVHNTRVSRSACSTGNFVLNSRLIFCRADTCSLSNMNNNLKCFSRQRLKFSIEN